MTHSNILKPLDQKYPFLKTRKMENRFIYMIFVCAAGILFGCYNPQRDLSIDPYNTPLIHILDAAYEANAGMVVVQWEYLGQKRVENFVLERRDISGFRNIARSSGADANGQYATAGTFRDEELIAGERVQYRVVAEHSEGGIVSTSAVEVLIPGAGLREIRRDPVDLAVQFVWQVEAGDVVSYDVVRAPAGGDYETIFTTQDPQQTSFWDRSVAGNHAYTYAIRSRLSTGVQLTSRSVRVQFYREAGRHVVETLRGTTERMRLSAAGRDGEADMLALIVLSDQTSLSRLRHTLNVDIPDRPHILRHLVGTSLLQLNDLMPQSVDLTGPPLAGQGAFPRAYIGGINSTGRVVVVGIELLNNTQVWHIPDNWVSASSHVRLAQDDQQRVYVATGGQLRVYSAAGSPVGIFDLEYRDPVDIAVHNGVIWVAWTNRVQRGDVQFSEAGHIAWEDVLLEPQIAPRALTLNAAGQVFVLDRTHVRVFRADGTALISWPLPSGAFAAGDLTIGGSALNLVHLSDENGGVTTYVP